MQIQEINNTLIPSVLELNNQHINETSELDLKKIQHLVDQSYYAKCIGNCAAFLLVLDENAQYENPNFSWFNSTKSHI